jgi:hypothetical protein
MRGGFSRYTSVRGPESHEGARESLKGHIALTITRESRFDKNRYLDPT